MYNLAYKEDGCRIGCLSFRKHGFLDRLQVRPTVVSIAQAFSESRVEVEQFITDIYRKSYDADIRVNYPILMSMRDQSGKILAATGFRPAAEAPLFLEQYLDQPIEALVGCKREQIVEIGNLASDGGGASLFLFAALAAYLNGQGYSHAVVTSTNFLKRRFTQMGLDPKIHAFANPAQLVGDTDQWGSYYATMPQVISGSVAQGYKRLQGKLGAEYVNYPEKIKIPLFPRLHFPTSAEEVAS